MNQHMQQATFAACVPLKKHLQVKWVVYSTFTSVMDIPAPCSVILPCFGSVGCCRALTKAHSSHRFKVVFPSDSPHLLFSPPPLFSFQCLPRLRSVMPCSPSPSAVPTPRAAHLLSVYFSFVCGCSMNVCQERRADIFFCGGRGWGWCERGSYAALNFNKMSSRCSSVGQACACCALCNPEV